MTCIFIDDKTNGEIIQNLFPDYIYDEYLAKDYMAITVPNSGADTILLDKTWWDAPYNGDKL